MKTTYSKLADLDLRAMAVLVTVLDTAQENRQGLFNKDDVQAVAAIVRYLRADKIWEIAQKALQAAYAKSPDQSYPPPPHEEIREYMLSHVSAVACRTSLGENESLTKARAENAAARFVAGDRTLGRGVDTYRKKTLCLTEVGVGNLNKFYDALIGESYRHEELKGVLLAVHDAVDRTRDDYVRELAASALKDATGIPSFEYFDEETLAQIGCYEDAHRLVSEAIYNAFTYEDNLHDRCAHAARTTALQVVEERAHEQPSPKRSPSQSR